MADKEKLKRLLRESVRVRGMVLPEEKLSQAVEQLSIVKKASKADLENLGESIANDPRIFTATDMDSINDILDSDKKK